jgi:molybdopterin synthase catalytic subunit
MKVSVQRENFDAGLEIRKLAGDGKVGAIASFVGLVRDVPMSLEHYPGMTEREIAKIVEEAGTRWKVIDATVIHRYGELKPTEQIVLVVVASAHRADAFAACEFIMDYLKTRAPFWKKEHRPEGTRWVEARSSDDEAAERWQDPTRKAG